MGKERAKALVLSFSICVDLRGQPCACVAHICVCAYQEYPVSLTTGGVELFQPHLYQPVGFGNSSPFQPPQYNCLGGRSCPKFPCFQCWAKQEVAYPLPEWCV